MPSVQPTGGEDRAKHKPTVHSLDDDCDGSLPDRAPCSVVSLRVARQAFQRQRLHVDATQVQDFRRSRIHHLGDGRQHAVFE